MRAILLVHPAFLHELSRLGVAYSKTHTGLDCKRFLSNRIDRDFPLITKKKKETLISHFLSAPLVTSMQLIENRSVRYTGDQKSGCGSIVRHLIFVETLIAWSLVTSPCRKPKKNIFCRIPPGPENSTAKCRGRRLPPRLHTPKGLVRCRTLDPPEFPSELLILPPTVANEQYY